MDAKKISEKAIETLFLICAVASIVIVFAIIIFLINGGYPIIKDWFLHGFGMRWLPDIGYYGSIPLIFLTFYGGIGCTLVATAIGFPTAIYLSEFANMKIRNIIKPSLEVLTGIPSVVMGLVGAALVVKAIWESTGQVNTGPGLLAVWIVVGIMSVPTVASISEDSIRAVPKELKEAALGLGATRWQTMTQIIIPAAKSGILTSILLGMGNAMGETMAASMVIGGSLSPSLSLDILHPTNLIPQIVVASAGGDVRPDSMVFHSLYAIGFILFLIIAILNLAIRMSLRKGNTSGTSGQRPRN